MEDSFNCACDKCGANCACAGAAPTTDSCCCGAACTCGDACQCATACGCPGAAKAD